MRTILQDKFALVLVMAGLFAANPVFADKPEWAGGDKQGKNTQEWRNPAPKGSDKGRDEARYRAEDRRDDRGPRAADRRDIVVNRHFDDRQRTVIHEYYADSYRSGRCPPGLAKKHNGCQPPGQAKKWVQGRPLPRDVVYYELPPRVVVNLGAPPAGHKYVRVATDILLIAIGTGMVVDAIQDLGGR